MKGSNKYRKQLFIDGVQTSYKEIARIFGISEITARNIYTFELNDNRNYRGRILKYQWIKLFRIFNINGNITDDHKEAARWLGIGQDTLYTYICANPNGWNLSGNYVTFKEEWRVVDYASLNRIKRKSELSQLVETPASYDLIEANGVKIVRKLVDNTVIKSYGWSVGQKYLQA